jgi:hypothetical protein
MILSSSSSAAPVVWSSAQGGNNHAYELVLNDVISWSGARDAASASGGYLATETSAAEQQFINAVLTAADAPTGQYWLGLRRVEGSPFGWDNGDAMMFSGWDAGEPNDYQGLEDSGAVLWSRSGDVDFGRRGSWNDSSEAGYATGEHPGHPDLARAGFVIERDASLAVVPLPPAAYLFAPSAALAFACWRRANCRG